MKIVAPLHITTGLVVGDNTWIGAEFSCWGNGKVTIENNCDIAPQVTILTGTHDIGDREHRAGHGKTADCKVGSGTWLGARCTILPGVSVGCGCVIAAGGVVTSDTNSDELIGGVPAKKIKQLP